MRYEKGKRFYDGERNRVPKSNLPLLVELGADVILELASQSAQRTQIRESRASDTVPDPSRTSCDRQQFNADDCGHHSDDTKIMPVSDQPQCPPEVVQQVK